MKRFLTIRRVYLVITVLFLCSGITFFFAIRCYSDFKGRLYRDGERISEMIISATLDHVNHNNRTKIRESTLPFLDLPEVKGITIRDSGRRILFEEKRDMEETHILTLTRNIDTEHITVGTLELKLGDSGRWVEATGIFRLMADSLGHHIWQYEAAMLRKKSEALFKDDSIISIKITEESGLPLVDLSRSGKTGDMLHMSKDFHRDNRYVGTLTMSFITREDVAHLRVRTILRTFGTFFFTVALLILGIMGISSLWKIRPPGILPSSPSDKNQRWKISTIIETKMQRVEEYILENYDRTISREGLAAMVDLNQDNLGRYFKLYSGMKIKDFINVTRMRHVKVLLREGTEPITAIAYKVGFENMSTFNRIFKEQTGISPSEFRNKK